VASRRETILIVDDEPAICDTLRDILEDEGFDVEVACDGVDALEALGRMSVLPRVLILDLLMPRMDGNELLTNLRADPVLAGLPVVVSTSDPSRAPNGVLIMKKPVDLELLLSTVRNVSIV
jgi:CheY-like chemotaxis protein